MPAAAHLPHRCIVERDMAAASSLDTHRNHAPRWTVVGVNIPCRLVIDTQQVPDGVLAEGPIVTTYTALFSARTDLRPGGMDRIVGITDRRGMLVEAGPFTIDSLRRPTGGTGARSHISAGLTLRGGKHEA